MQFFFLFLCHIALLLPALVVDLTTYSLGNETCNAEMKYWFKMQVLISHLNDLHSLVITLKEGYWPSAKNIMPYLGRLMSLN